MSASATIIPALLPGASLGHSKAVLGAMRAVAETGGTASEADRAALASADRFIFGHDGPFSFDAIAPMAPGPLAQTLAGTGLGGDALKFITVMALVDGAIDKAKIGAVAAYAAALGISERYLDDVAAAAEGRLQEALADMTRCNMESITGRTWAEGDVSQWLLPYARAGDPELARRFEALEQSDAASFGRAFWLHFKENGYDFPGAPKALNAAFSVPHDSVHVLSGYDTSPRGELLASTFTAAMHPKFPMAGHILPVIFSWHLNVQINAVAGETASALDPRAFWKAWAAGAAAKADTFAPGWDFWSLVDVPLVSLRQRYSIPAGGLDQSEA